MMKSDSHADAPGEETRLQLVLLLIYEDTATGLRAWRALNRVLHQLETMADGQFHIWRLDMLRDPACQAEATRDALDADVVALSIHGTNPLSEQAEASLRHWINLKRDQPCALVISLDATAESNPALIQIGSEAAHKGLKVFFQYGEAPHSEVNFVIGDIRPGTDARSPAVEEALCGSAAPGLERQ